jgi:serine protease AprX
MRKRITRCSDFLKQTAKFCNQPFVSNSSLGFDRFIVVLTNRRSYMKASLIVITFFYFAVDGFSQYPKWVIQFTDKNNSPYTVSNPAAYLSKRAIERRTRYNIPIDTTDLPVNPSYIQQVISKAGVTYLSQSKWLNQVLISCNDSATVAAISLLPFVKATSPVGFFAASRNDLQPNRFEEVIAPAIASSSLVASTTGDTIQYGTSSEQVHIHNGEYLHNKGYTGNGITIAMLDAGFYHYKELSAFDSIRTNQLVLGERDFVDYDNSVDEDNAHGMYCLSTIAADLPGTMVGTAPHAAFWLLRSENANSEYPVEEHNWVAAAEFADSAGADMISSSLGYFYFDDSQFNHSYEDIYANMTTVSKGAAMAAKKGMIVTNSAGNEGDNAWHYIIFPADADSVCTVGAVDYQKNIASFSSYGYPGKVKPNIVSVGVNTTIFGTDNTPVTGSGTSFSNPNINGLIACLWQAFPQYNNMTILNAVYQSADRFNNPDDQYGYGIPDMKQAYLILKTKQNIELYGKEWLFASPDPFDNRIQLRLIGQVNGNAHLTLQDADGNIISNIPLLTEQQEVYDTAFLNLQDLPGGEYFIKYTDSLSTKTIAIKKKGIIMNDWLVALPVPFVNRLTVYIKGIETGKADLRLTDAAGRTIETKTLQIVEDNIYTVNFTKAGALPHAVYFIQYIGSKKKTIALVK